MLWEEEFIQDKRAREHVEMLEQALQRIEIEPGGDAAASCGVQAERFVKGQRGFPLIEYEPVAG